MKLLVVSQWFPLPPTNGARQRAYHLIRGLAERHEVHLLSFIQEKDQFGLTHELSDICRKITVLPEVPYRPAPGNAVRALISPIPRSVISTWSPMMARLVQEEIRSESFDAAIALTTKAGEYLKSCKLPKILDNDNVDSAYFARIVSLADNPFNKFRRKLTWVKVARHEEKLVASFDATTAVSEEDRRALAKQIPSAEDRGAIFVVPNGVDLKLVDYRIETMDPRSLVFTGALTYQANLDAAIFFCEKILPRIRLEVPDVQPIITGSYSGIDVNPLLEAGVTLTGFIEDIRPVVAGSAALVAPLRIGGGTRLKILEAMALGTPVVATKLGAAGIGAEHGRTAFLADNPEDFARYAVSLIKDAALRETISKNAKEYVIVNFGWERSIEALENVVQFVGRKKME